MQQNLDNIIELASKGKILTTEQVDKFLTMVLTSLSTQRKELNIESKQRIEDIKQVMKYIEVEHKNILDEWTSKLDATSQKTLSDLTSNIQSTKDTLKEAQSLLDVIKAYEVKDGKDADEEVIVERVVDRIKIDPTVVTISAEEVKNKLESLKGDKKLDISAVKGFDLYSKKVDLDYAVKTLQHQTSTLINRGGVKSIVAGTNVTVDATDPSNPVVSSTGGGASPLTTKGDLYTYSTADARLGVGTNGQVLTADSAEVTGLKWSSAGGSGITRSVNVISTPTTAGATAATDYYYIVSGTTTLTLPTAVGNTNIYSVTRSGTNTVTVATTGGQTIIGSASATLTIQYQTLTLVSDGSNWVIA